MQTKTITKTEVKKIINSCDFLDAKYMEELLSRVKDMNGRVLESTYKKVKEAKRQIENIYLDIAVQNDPTGGKLLKKTLKLIKQSI